MVSGKHKSRSLRKVFVKTPGGKTKIHYRSKKPKKPICAEDGTQLHGIPRLKASKMKNLSKSKKRPSRPFAGVLSSKAMRRKMKEKAKALKFGDKK